MPKKKVIRKIAAQKVVAVPVFLHAHFRILGILSILISIGLFLWLFKPLFRQEPASLPPHETNESFHRFVLMGDTGTGAAAQKNVAAAIQEVCSEKKNCEAVFIIGDVFYETGVRSISDPQFQEKFEKPYANVPLRFLFCMAIMIT